MKFLGHRWDLYFISLIFSCTSLKPESRPGIQDIYTSFVPARTAVMACQTWPNGASYYRKPVSINDPTAQIELCKSFDRFILGGFENQPYMRGFSPPAVAKLLESSQSQHILSDLPRIWSNEVGPCPDCPGSLGFYEHQLQNHLSWRMWLNRFSVAARNADAILLPFVTFVNEQALNDRGLAVIRRSAGVVLLLVDTNNGKLIWGRAHEAVVKTQGADATVAHANLSEPAWSSLHNRLFVDNLWREFPGRQTFE